MKETNFDCVEMKSIIQRELLQEETELGVEEARRRRKQRVLDNPILGPIFKELSAKVSRKDESEPSP